MGRAGYHHGTTGVVVLITANSSERRVLNMDRSVLSISEKSHESAPEYGDAKRFSSGRMCRVLSQAALGSANSRRRSTRAIQFNPHPSTSVQRAVSV